MTAAVVCTALLALLVFGLGMNVSRVRSRSSARPCSIAATIAFAASGSPR